MRKLTALLAAGLVLGLSGQAMAATTGTATVGGTVIAPMTIDSSKTLQFGTFVQPEATTGPFTVVVAADGSRTGTAKRVSSVAGAAATFNVTGESALAYTAKATYVSAVATGLTLTDVSFSCAGRPYASATTATGYACTPAGTSDSIVVGGTLTVANTAVAGGFSSAAHISLNVEYQ